MLNNPSSPLVDQLLSKIREPDQDLDQLALCNWGGH